MSDLLKVTVTIDCKPPRVFRDVPFETLYTTPGLTSFYTADDDYIITTLPYFVEWRKGKE